MLKNTFDQQKSDIADSLDDFARRLRALSAENVNNFGPAFFQEFQDKVKAMSEDLEELELECEPQGLEEDLDSEDIEGSDEEG